MSKQAPIHGMFEQLFQGVSEPYVALAPDAPHFTILAVNDAFEHLVRRSRDELEGVGFFDIFPTSADGQEASHLDELRRSLARVAQEGGSDMVGAFRCGIPLRSETSEGLLECWWSSRNTAIVDDGEVAYILHRVEEITEFVSHRPDETSQPKDPRPEDAASDEVVLIVEPDPRWRDYLERLSSVKWQTYSTADPIEALEIARQVEPQIIVVDEATCGEGDGDLISCVRGDARLSSCRVIALIHRRDAQSRDEVMRRGADDALFERAPAREILSRIQAQLTVVQSQKVVAERSRQQFHQLFMSAPVFIAVLEGPEHVYTLNNPAHKELLGYREVIGRSVREIFGHGVSHDAIKHLDTVYETGEVFSAEETLVKLTDPHTGVVDERYLTLAYLPTHDLSGAIDGVAVFGWDVTELVEARKTVEKQALQLRRESKFKDEFLAMLGHELRNPLSPLATLGQILDLHEGALEPDRVEWAANIINRQVGQLIGLVDDLLDVARISEGRIDLDPGRYELEEIFKPAVESIEPLVERNHQALAMSRPEGKVVLEVDKTRLIQVISNLLHNATKYTPEGGEIGLEAVVEGDEIVITVEDTGEGIDAEMLPHVFDLFRQSDTSLARPQGGLGLGLTLVRRLVEMHGGSVCAMSDGLGKGSRFEVRLPVVCASMDAESGVAVAQKSS